MPDEPMIEIDELSKTYRDGLFRRRKIRALQEVSFRVGRGEVFGLLGPNGAGKTTLIKVLLGIVGKTAGAASMLGKPAGNRRARRQVGYLPESHRIPRHLTADTALEYYGRLSGMSMSELKRRRPELIETVGLTGWNRTSVKKFSKGMLQRLGLAQAMLHDPELLILDEPTDGVDPVGRAEIRAVLEQLRDRGKTVFLNSHLLQELELVCDRVAILDRGRLRRVGAVSEITEGAGKDSNFEVVLTLAGEEKSIRDALGSREPPSWKPTATDRFEVVLPFADQSEVDRCIDDLRGSRISVLSFSRRKLTLEEAFIEIVQDEK